jgi:hypothetical protein
VTDLEFTQCHEFVSGRTLSRAVFISVFDVSKFIIDNSRDQQPVHRFRQVWQEVLGLVSNFPIPDAATLGSMLFLHVRRISCQDFVHFGGGGQYDECYYTFQNTLPLVLV